MSADQKRQVLHYYDKGLSTKRIAAAMSLSLMQVRNTVERRVSA